MTSVSSAQPPQNASPGPSSASSSGPAGPAASAPIAPSAGADEARGDATSDVAADPAATAEAVFQRVEEVVPGFGGYFLDEQGHLDVYLTDTDRAEAARARVRSSLGEDRYSELGSPEIRVLRGRYAYSELSRWNERLAAIHGVRGVSMSDLDEAHNRLRVGIESEDDRLAIQKALEMLGVPPEAVQIDVTGPIRFMSTLRSTVRPVVGGLQIVFGCNLSGCFVCTDGFTAQRSGTDGFVTASHCTEDQGAVDGVDYFQPAPAAGGANDIASERVDPSYFSGGACPSGRRCRYSDSAFASASVRLKRGLIARPSALGSTTIDPDRPRFKVVHERTAPLSGERLNKVGRTTGWSAGNVVGTCLTVDVSGTDFTLLCQDQVHASVQGGDSGAPVFKIERGSKVGLSGILWGGDNGGNNFFFSAFGNIQDELGTLAACTANAGC